jgi:hypothetical protein
VTVERNEGIFSWEEDKDTSKFWSTSSMMISR